MAIIILVQWGLLVSIWINLQRCQWCFVVKRPLPSGKHTKHDRKSPFFMGKTTVSKTIFNSYVRLPEGNEFKYIYQLFQSWKHTYRSYSSTNMFVILLTGTLSCVLGDDHHPTDTFRSQEIINCASGFRLKGRKLYIYIYIHPNGLEDAFKSSKTSENTISGSF